MSFRSTGKTIEYKRNESLMYCDHCNKQISLDAWRTGGHWEVRFDADLPYGESSDGYDFCSLECIVEWCERQPGYEGA